MLAFGQTAGSLAPILMVDNFLPVFDINEETAIDKREDEQLEAALRDVAERRKYIPEATEEGRELHRRVAKMQKMAGILPESPLKIEKSCNGCGLCAKVCPARNITVEDGRAKHGKSCEFCLACANLCPQKAVRPRMADKNPNARYRNPNISIDEIIRANGQDGR